MEKEQVNKIKKFIIDNGLDFEGTGSELNSVCCVISGYALFIGVVDVTELVKNVTEISTDSHDELFRVFEYANDNDYGDWWAHGEAKEQYKF